MDINNPKMCTSNVQQHAQAGALLVDVRERGDAQALAFDAPEVMHLPFSEMKSRWQELPRNRELLIVCHDGEKSVLVSRFLREQGFPNVSPMRGGILLWMQKGYPVIGKRFNAPADSEQSLNSIEKDQEPWASQ